MFTMTQKRVKELYEEYNAKYFNGELTCSIEVTKSARFKRRFGDFSPRRNHIRVHGAPLSRKTENDWKGTIIHEMVHAVLCKRYGARNCGHTSRFHALLAPMMNSEFGIRYARSRFHQTALATAGQTPTPTAPTGSVKRYKVLTSGKIGELVRESTIYGKKHITLKVEGMLFPFTTQLDNVEAIAA